MRDLQGGDTHALLALFSGLSATQRQKSLHPVDTQPECHYWFPWDECSIEQQVCNWCLLQRSPGVYACTFLFFKDANVLLYF